MKPRKQKFKQDNKLKFCYTKDNRDFGNDYMGIVPKGEQGRWDLYLLFMVFLRRPIADNEWDKETKKFIKQPTFVEELEKRGYDTTTIYFEIEKKNNYKKDTSTEKGEFFGELNDNTVVLSSGAYHNLSNHAKANVEKAVEIKKSAIKEFAEEIIGCMRERNYMGVGYKQGVFTDTDIKELVKKYNIKWGSEDDGN